jgi:hypothetical protein
MTPKRGTQDDPREPRLPRFRSHLAVARVEGLVVLPVAISPGVVFECERQVAARTWTRIALGRR